MKTYTVTQNGGYQVLRTFDKLEAEKCLAEMESRSKGSFYICEQGYDPESSEAIEARIKEWHDEKSGQLGGL